MLSADGTSCSPSIGKSSEWVLPFWWATMRSNVEKTVGIVGLTFERKKRTREEVSKGIRPEIVNGRDLAARTLDTLSRKRNSSSMFSSSNLEATRLDVAADGLELCSISKSNKLGLPVYGKELEAERAGEGIFLGVTGGKFMVSWGKNLQLQLSAWIEESTWLHNLIYISRGRSHKRKFR